ncbi:hypothetical protein D3C74_91430 [compost metagenome]
MIQKMLKKFFLKEQSKTDNLKKAAPSNNFEVIEKSITYGDRAYNYRAIIQLHSITYTNLDLSVIASKIQESLGKHPIGYYSYDLECKDLSDGVKELTWKSWDSCD